MLEEAASRRPKPALSERLTRRLRRWLAELRRARSRRRKHRSGEPLIVLLEVDWRLGDEIMTLPVIEAMHRAEPGLRIAVRMRYPELVAGNPFVFAVNEPSLVPDRVVHLKGEVPGQARRATLARRAGVSLDGIAPRIYLSYDELHVPPFTELSAVGTPLVALHTGATQSCKAWSIDRWREVAKSLRDHGIASVQIGQPTDPGLPTSLDLRGRTDVRALARSLAWCDLLVGEDSGPLHLALAVGTPAIGLFGATDPALLFDVDARLTAIRARSECRFCWPQRRLAYPSGVCPLPDHDCMRSIAVDDVRQAIETRLGGLQCGADP